jgi:hypothetical protein
VIFIDCGLTEDYLKNIAVEPSKNLDHITAYIIVSNKFKKVTQGIEISDLQIKNLFDFYKNLNLMVMRKLRK